MSRVGQKVILWREFIKVVSKKVAYFGQKLFDEF